MVMKTSDTEGAKIFVVSPDWSILCNTVNEEIDEKEPTESNPTSSVGRFELHRQRSNRATPNKANARYFEWNSGKNVTTEKKNSQEKAKCGMKVKQSSSKSVSSTIHEKVNKPKTTEIISPENEKAPKIY